MVVGGRERVARKLAAETRYLITFCTNLNLARILESSIECLASIIFFHLEIVILIHRVSFSEMYWLLLEERV